MFTLVVEHPQKGQKRHAFDKESITLGRSVTNDLQLPEANISRRHARVSRISGVFYVEDLGSNNGTRVNDGDPIVGTIPMAIADRIRIGEYQIYLEPIDMGDEITVERAQPLLEPTEAELVEAVLAHDDDARLVYADWLEGHGFGAQAEYLRLEEQILAASEQHPDLDDWVERLRVVTPATPLSWRRKLSRRLVEPCSAAHWPDCPREWPRLNSTGGEEVRFCGTCDRDVFYCLSIEEAQQHTRANQRVVLDAAVPRKPYDLFGDPPMGPNNPPRPRK